MNLQVSVRACVRDCARVIFTPCASCLRQCVCICVLRACVRACKFVCLCVCAHACVCMGFCNGGGSSDMLVCMRPCARVHVHVRGLYCPYRWGRISGAHLCVVYFALACNHWTLQHLLPLSLNARTFSRNMHVLTFFSFRTQPITGPCDPFFVSTSTLGAPFATCTWRTPSQLTVIFGLDPTIVPGQSISILPDVLRSANGISPSSDSEPFVVLAPAVLRPLAPVAISVSELNVCRRLRTLKPFGLV